MGWPNGKVTWFGAGLVALAGFGCQADVMDQGYQPATPLAGNQAPPDTTVTPDTTVPPDTTVTPDTTVPPDTTVGPDTTTPPATVNLGEVPCDVNKVVERNCHTCHGAQPVGGAVRLVTQEDWHKMSMSPKYDPTKPVFEIAQIRINDGSMPQGKQMTAEDKSMLDSWLLGGAKGATEAETKCTAGTTEPVTPPTSGHADQCKRPGAFDPLVAEPGETCWEFPVHGPGSMDSKFTVAMGESYHEWYYNVPWPAGHVMTRFGQKFDNEKVLHHYLTFSRPNSTRQHGDLDQNVTGTTLGDAAELVSGWAVGGCATTYPDDVGVFLESRGKVMIQWHMFNTTGGPQQDHSIVQVCTVPKEMRKNIAGLTFLGTELLGAGFLGMPPGMNDAKGTCLNDSGKDIFVVGWTPHMHEIGVNMKTELRRADGTMETVFDEPFQFDYQTNYMEATPLQVKAGEALVTTCTFNNTTGANVAFGQSTKAEMCYQFTLAYPYGALNNGVLSLIGATNTCW